MVEKAYSSLVKVNEGTCVQQAMEDGDFDNAYERWHWDGRSYSAALSRNLCSIVDLNCSTLTCTRLVFLQAILVYVYFFIYIHFQFNSQMNSAFRVMARSYVSFALSVTDGVSPRLSPLQWLKLGEP